MLILGSLFSSVTHFNMEGIKLLRTFIWLFLLILCSYLVFQAFQNLLEPEIGVSFEQSNTGTFPCMTFCMSTLDPAATNHMNSFQDIENQTSILNIIEVKLMGLTTK